MMTRRGFLAAIPLLARRPAAAVPTPRPFVMRPFMRTFYCQLTYGQSFTVERVAAELFKEQLALVRARGAAKQREVDKLIADTFLEPFAPSTASQDESRRASWTRSTR